MQPYTHGAIGLLIGTLAHRNPLVHAACAVGAMIPDAPIIIKWGIDKLRGKPPLMWQGRTLRFFKSFTHSAGVWAVVVYLVGARIEPWEILIWYAAMGAFSHIVVDLFTHGDPRFQAFDALYFYPLQQEPWNIGKWDYRIATGAIWPLKTFELMTLTFCLTMVVMYWFFQYLPQIKTILFPTLPF